jgi:hypothetical protein
MSEHTVAEGPAPAAGSAGTAGPAAPGGRPLGRRVQAGVMRVANVPMRAMLRLPVSTPVSKRLMLAYITGRKTGRVYRVPLSRVSHDGVLLTPGGGNWTRNLAAGEPVRLLVRGRQVIARPELISDPGEVRRLLTVMLAANPAIKRFGGFHTGPDGSLNQAEIENAVRFGFVVVRWNL